MKGTSMRRVAIAAAAVAVGLVLGCKPQEPPPAPAPEPQPKPVVKTWKADDELGGGGTTTVRTPPPLPPLPPASQPAAGTRKYTVKAKDTMIGIARTELGNEHRLSEIKALNPGVNPDHLSVGQELVLPAK